MVGWALLLGVLGALSGVYRSWRVPGGLIGVLGIHWGAGGGLRGLTGVLGVAPRGTGHLGALGGLIRALGGLIWALGGEF